MIFVNPEFVHNKTMDSNEGALSLATPKLPISFAIRLQETLAGFAPVNLVVVAGIND